MLQNAGYLPKIKCTNCGIDIDIERMGDHLCGPGLGAATGRSLPRSFNDAFSNMSVNQSIPAPFKQKPIPRPIDSNAANVPYHHHYRNPNSMQHHNETASPMTAGRRAPPLQRSTTHPMRPISPVYTLPQGCAFPPFPLPSKSPTSRKLDRSNTEPLRSGNSDKDFRNRESGKSSVYNRADTQKISDGAFHDGELFMSNPTNSQLSSSSQRPTMKPLVVFSDVQFQPLKSVATSIPSLTSISGEVAYHERNKSVSAANRPLIDIGSIRRAKPVGSQGEYHQSSSNLSAPRSASAQGHRHDKSMHDNAPPIPGNSDGRAHIVPRSASAMGSRDRRAYDEPPLPNQHMHHRPEAQNTTNHTPSDSTSSKQSNDSQATTSSSRSSPPRSTASTSPHRSNNHDSGNSGRKSADEPERPKARSTTRSFSRPSYARPTIPILSPDTFDQVTAGPWQSELKARSREVPKPLDIQAAHHVNGPFRENPPHPPAPESPLDPALKNNRLPIINTRVKVPLATPDFQEAARSAIMPTAGKHGMFQDTLASSSLPRTTLRRAATTSKGKCRGCSETITGKSVSSADGRLTGRWHKQCFTCKTCSEPFPTMDFYVIGNDPYCNRHYHRLNKSLCSNCDRGIEGQYVDNNLRKFHPHCFTCSECHLILRDAYFDVNGTIFCERHAFKLDTLPPFGAGRRYPEKRSTRLMMI